MHARSSLWFFLFVFVIAAGLVADQCFSLGQILVDAGAWLAFLALLKVSSNAERTRFIICLALATIGEILLCHFFHLYTYREKNIPLFVPPGHVLLYACGLWLAPRMTKWLWLIVLIPALAYSFWCLFRGADQLSLVLFALWCFIIWRKPVRPLVSVMFVLALGMEIIGTSLGNWAWSPHILFLDGSLSQNNPPFAAGVFYCGLDFLVAILLTPKKKTSSNAYDKIDNRCLELTPKEVTL